MELTLEIGGGYEFSFAFGGASVPQAQPILFAPETLRSHPLLGSVMGTEENTQEV